MMIAVGSKRSVRTIKEKYDAFKDVQSGMLKKAVSEKYKIPRNTLSMWLPSQKKIITASGKSNPKRKNTKNNRHKSIRFKLLQTYFAVENTLML